MLKPGRGPKDVLRAMTITRVERGEASNFVAENWRKGVMKYD